MQLPKMPRLQTSGGRKAFIGVLMICAVLTACAPVRVTRPNKAVSATEAAICAAWEDSLPPVPDLPSRADTAATQNAVWQVRAAIYEAVKIHAAACVGPQ